MMTFLYWQEPTEVSIIILKLDYLQVTSGVGVRSVASLGLNIAGEHFEAAASGNGPVDAAITALKKDY